MLRTTTFILFCGLLTAIQCDGSPPPSTDEIVVGVGHKSLAVGTSFRAQIEAQSVIPRFLSKRKAKRMGQIRAIDTRTSFSAKFYAELVAAQPEKWRIDFETFARTTQTMGAEEAISTHELPDKAFFVEFTDPIVVTDEHGAEVTESQTQYSIAIANVLRERTPWGKFVGSREFRRGKIVEAPDELVPGRFAEAAFGPITDAHNTVAFFRFGQDEAKAEVAYFEVHSRFKATEPKMVDGSYLDLEAKGRTILRVADGMLTGYEVDAKVTPRASTGAMLPEGSGTWKVSFTIEPQTLQAPEP